MSRRHLRLFTIAGTVLVVVWFAAVSLLARLDVKRSASTGVPAPLAIGTQLQRPRPLPPLTLVDEHGKPFSLSTWRGKWVILAPSMTLCHEVCPMTTGALMQMTDQVHRAGLSGHVVVAEATVDPWRDSPARLRAYRRLSGANFVMLTGSQAEIHRLWKFFGVYYQRVPQGKPPDMDWLTHRAETFDVQHTDALFFIDPSGQERIVDEGMPDVGGHLSPVLRNLLNDQGRQNLAHPDLPWTAPEALDDLYFLMNRNVPAGAVPKANAPSARAAQASLAGSPAALAALHRQAGQLIAGTLSKRLPSLRGYPVVVNVWASWCGPCRTEFPLLATASARFGRRVAFLGADTNDSDGSARAFLAGHPVSYPSYPESSSDLSSLAVLDGVPTTIFIDGAGKVVNVHTGQYDTQAALDNDIQHYALGASS